MNFTGTDNLTVIYQASALLAYNNPQFSANQIMELLGVETPQQKHKVRLGVWKAHKKLGLVKGYSQAGIPA